MPVCFISMLYLIMNVIEQNKECVKSPTSIHYDKTEAENMRYRVANFIFDQIPTDTGI